MILACSVDVNCVISARLKLSNVTVIAVSRVASWQGSALRGHYCISLLRRRENRVVLLRFRARCIELSLLHRLLDTLYRLIEGFICFKSASQNLFISFRLLNRGVDIFRLHLQLNTLILGL